MFDGNLLYWIELSFTEFYTPVIAACLIMEKYCDSSAFEVGSLRLQRGSVNSDSGMAPLCVAPEEDDRSSIASTTCSLEVFLLP